MSQLRASSLLLLAAAGLTVHLSSAAEAPAGSAPAWHLVMSWSPQYCDKNLSSKEVQCDGTRLLLPQWLVPVSAAADGGECQKSATLSADVLEHLSMTTMNRTIVQKRWAQQGGCIADQSAYLTLFDLTSRRVSIPVALSREPLAADVGRDDIAALFAQDNPGLPADAVMLRCTRGWLVEVELCFDRAMKFSHCPVSSQQSCDAKVKLRGNRAAN